MTCALKGNKIHYKELSMDDYGRQGRYGTDKEKRRGEKYGAGAGYDDGKSLFSDVEIYNASSFEPGIPADV